MTGGAGREGASPGTQALVVLGGALTAVVVMVWLRESPWPFDPMFYMDNAKFFTGDRVSLATEHRSLRWGLMLPLGALQGVFGYSEAAYYGIPILATALLVVAVFLVGRRLMGPWSSVFAGLIAALNPIVLARASHPFPDVLATALFSLGIAAILWMGGGSAKRDMLLGLAAGAAFGLGYAVREVVVVLAPVVVICLILVRARIASIAALVGAALGFLALEFVLMELWFGDPFTRLGVLVGRNTATGPLSDAAREKIAQIDRFQGSLWLSLTAMWRRWAAFGTAAILLAAPVGFVLGTLHAPRGEARRRWLGVGAWLAAGWAVFVLLGLWRTTRNGFVFNLQQIRYWYLLVPPSAIGLVALVREAWRALPTDRPVRRAGRVLTTLTLSALIVLFVWDAAGGPFQIVSGRDHMLEFRGWVSGSNEDVSTIAGADRAVRIADMFDATTFGEPLWDGRLDRRGRGRSPGAFLLSIEDTTFHSATVDGSPVDLSAPPVEWDTLLVSANGALAIVGPDGGNPGTNLILSPSSPGEEILTDEPQSWFFSLPTAEVGRLHLTFEGDVPRAWCVTDGQSNPALRAGPGVDVGPDRREVAFYCPPTSRPELRLAAPLSSGTTVIDLVFIVDGG